jgi:basic membrane protein A
MPPEHPKKPFHVSRSLVFLFLFVGMLYIPCREVNSQNRNPLHPGILYDASLSTDIGFNRQASEGLNRFFRDTETGFVEVFETDLNRRLPALRHMAERGADPIIGVGFGNLSAIREAALLFPATRFIIIDAEIDLPNVQSLLFKEQEGAFLAGILAALATQTKQVGFIGGRDIPPIQRFRCGFFQGIQFASSDIFLLEAMADSFSDPETGKILAKKLYDQGADIIFAAAGTTGEGVLEQAGKSGKLAIGVDVNQNYLVPGKILTSVIKRVDNAVYTALMATYSGNWKPGPVWYGLKDHGVGIALDMYSRPLVSERMENSVRMATEAIVSGKLSVHDPSSDGKCPAPPYTLATLKDQ